MQLDVLYQDDDYVAINKPAGLLVHRTAIDRHETQFAVQLLRDQLGRYVYPVHRLDKPTSGILMFAFNKTALALLSQQFEKPNETNRVVKHYLAVVRGFMPASGQIDHPVKAVIDAYIDKPAKAKEAQTHYECLHHAEIPHAIDRYPQSRFSLVKLRPITGRRHQLRYHMKHCSHPIIGDAKYGKGNYNRYFSDHFESHRLLLSAIALDFFHPLQEKNIHLRACPGQDFHAACQTLGWTLSNETLHTNS